MESIKFGTPRLLSFVAGYDLAKDYISINKDGNRYFNRCNRVYSFNDILAHEIVHSVGSVSRLNRPLFSLHKSNPWAPMVDTRLFHTEEATAELGRGKLLTYLGLDDAFGGVEAYVQIYSEANRKDAERFSDESISYLINKFRINSAIQKAA